MRPFLAIHIRKMLRLRIALISLKNNHRYAEIRAKYYGGNVSIAQRLSQHAVAAKNDLQ